MRARYDGHGLRSRRIEFGADEDPVEALHGRGVTDGLPVVPPTPERVLRLLTGTGRRPDETVGVVPPDLQPATVEKVAINAVLAGCLPEHLPVVLAAVEACCDDAFNWHGLMATTMAVSPIVIVNGPVAARIGVASGGNVLGQGNRAALSIGRAVQLVGRNIGGCRPGGVDRATHGNPGKVGFCFAEDETDSPFGPLAGDGRSAVTVFAGEGSQTITDQAARTAEALAATIRSRLTPGVDALLVVAPDHARLFHEAGWTRVDLVAALAHPGEVVVTHAGGRAGLFTAVINGWATGLSHSVHREVSPWES